MFTFVIMSLKELLKHIDELQTQIQAHGKLDNEVLKRINYKFRLDWNYNSNVMEGNSLTKMETRSVMINNITLEGKPLKDVLEMRGHDEVITNILKIGKGELNLSEKRLLEIHKGIMYEDDPEKKKGIGIWKTDNNYLYNYKNERVDFTPHTEVKEKMHELINWLNTQKEKIAAKDKKALHPVVLAFEFHLRYIGIHPFYDGNGRTSRILTNLILIAYGYPPIIVKLEEKNKYYQYLADIQSYGGAPDLFYEFMGGLLVRSQQIVLDAIDGKDIDEPDDLYKEITLWSQEMEGIPDPLFRSGEVIYDLYQNCLKNFIFTFIEKNQIFVKLFKNTGIYLSIDHHFTKVKNDSKLNREDQKTIDEYINEFLHSDKETKDMNGLFIQINFNAFKKSIETFSERNGLNFEFHATKYCIKFENIELVRKTYKDFLTDEEINKIVDDTIRTVFERIKAKGSDYDKDA